MSPSTEAEIRHIYTRWHETVVARDLAGLLALYADDAMLETPLALKSHPTGVLTGKPALRAFFEAGFRTLGHELARWHRTGVFFANGRQLVWEHPRATPQGDQIDLVEVMDVAAGRIAHHRVYWGWVGFQLLTGAR